MPNRLAHASSPYLRQHAHQPVDWYPWGTEALEKARHSDRPIFLSVGYASCHWCHVMAHESFDDPAIAALLNRDFVSIKVDREERPDLDTLYMEAVTTFTGGQGGWPLHAFLTPDGRPFYGGTYFPPQEWGLMPSFRSVLEQVAAVWSRNRRQARDLGDSLARQIAGDREVRIPGPFPPDARQRLLRILVTAFDPVHGGFGGAPRFPPHRALEALLREADAGAAQALDLLTRTLDGMARGGMYDLLGGGFARYSVDATWTVPHFEKMLYDQAQLAPIYAEAWKRTGAERYARVARETLDFVDRELSGPGGSFLSSLDADDALGEGHSYTWTPQELVRVAGAQGPRLARVLSVTEEGQVEGGRSVLRLWRPWPQVSAEELALLDAWRPRLLGARQGRPRPGRDDKAVAAWVGLMAAAFARCGRILGEEARVDRARAALAFLDSTLSPDGRLHRTWLADPDPAGRGDRVGVPGFLDDHAARVLAWLEVARSSGRQEDLARAAAAADSMVEGFWDEEAGTFDYGGRDAEHLFARIRYRSSGSEPSATGLALQVVARLARAGIQPQRRALVDRALARIGGLVAQEPHAWMDEIGAWDLARPDGEGVE